MTTTYNWSTIREHITDATGDSPSADLEARIIETFQRHPADISHAAVRLSADYERGTVRSVWAVLSKVADEIDSRLSQDITAVAVPDRDRKVRQASQWMHAVGVHFDRWAEVEDELFGYSGRLQAWKNDDELKHEIEMLWVRLRPQGVQIEEEAVERAEAWKRAHALMKNG